MPYYYHSIESDEIVNIYFLTLLSPENMKLLLQIMQSSDLRCTVAFNLLSAIYSSKLNDDKQRNTKVAFNNFIGANVTYEIFISSITNVSNVSIIRQLFTLIGCLYMRKLLKMKRKKKI